MIKIPRSRSFIPALVSLVITGTAQAALDGYWPVVEFNGNFVDNTVLGGIDATLFNGATLLTDPERGQVLSFDGVDGYANAGTIPQLTLTNDYTWSFWILNETDIAAPGNNATILGNRYTADGPNSEYSPREFTKFTPTNFEFHRNTVGENNNYPDFVNPSPWTHVSVVKQADHFISYRNGLVTGVSRITEGQNNAHPLYFGGDQTAENWKGRLDDIGIWSNALPAASVAGLAKGTYNPATAPTSSNPAMQTLLSDGFDNGLGNWIPTNRGLENNAPAGYNDPEIISGPLNDKQVSLSGVVGSQYWFGNSIESATRYDSSIETLISVDRVSLTGVAAAGSAYRSSLWILGDDGHYLHFAQNVGENGWQWNARDDGGVGTLLPIGSGNDIPELNSLDADGGLHQMSIRLVPTGTIGEVNMFMFLDGTLVAGQGFSAFPDTFSVVLTGQARAIGDSVEAIFDNVVVQQVPEPASAMVLLGGLLGLAVRRRRS